MGFLTTEAENFAVLRQVKEHLDYSTFDSDEQLRKKLEAAPALEQWVNENVPWRLRGLYQRWISYHKKEIRRRLKDNQMWREVDKAKAELPVPPPR